MFLSLVMTKKYEAKQTMMKKLDEMSAMVCFSRLLNVDVLSTLDGAGTTFDVFLCDGVRLFENPIDRKSSAVDKLTRFHHGQVR